jgi:hypothetical protein
VIVLGVIFIMANITKYDDKQKRCPMLGHQIGFDYCRTLGNNFPCKKIFDCWFEQMSIVDFIKEHYGEKAVDKLLIPSKPKMLSLLELIEQAKNTQNKS